jgi:hypothetical protein
VGTATAVGTLAFARTYTPKAMAGGEHHLSKLLGNNAKSLRFSELLLSNLVQSSGALAGNVPTQLLYDKVVGNQPNKASPQRSATAK